MVPQRLIWEDVRDLIQAHLEKWNVTQFHPPAQWAGIKDADGRTIAAIGFTYSPDGTIVYMADIVCEESKRGVKAMIELANVIQTFLAESPKVQMVFSQTLWENTAMRKFNEKHTYLRPVSVVYRCTKADLVKDENGIIKRS